MQNKGMVVCWMLFCLLVLVCESKGASCCSEVGLLQQSSYCHVTWRRPSSMFAVINSHFPLTEQAPKWRLPSPIFRSIKMAHACNPHGPWPFSKPVPSTYKLRHPHPHTPFLQLSPRREQPGEKQLYLWPRLVPTLHATQQSSCWQPPSASPPALMTFINELHSLWILMKSG